ncbi:dual specificity protein phosphatase CDC14B-like isoform X2 [Schistocerca gregaria]|uniref:dual specificity protein phosphatase CDC14B-like isoform X2 n=1 Tax=Schistocerca gregaria TaxID=7010 RepID=UPI00211E27DE|nr:dual specificity protein phosphatase CDC14B-like isoform X2 [Schistocerca gregaria]
MRIKLVHYTGRNPKKRTNAAFLIGSYAIIYLEMTPKQAHDILTQPNTPRLLEFRDASMNATATYTITLMDCFEGLYRALQYGFFNFTDFDLDEYETYEMIQFGDLNWIIPEKFIAFCGPSATGRVYKKPEFYIKYFKMNNVVAVIRLNEVNYNAECFQKAGINHYELYFVDGGVPPHEVLQMFLEIGEKSNGAIAVHCKAGLGRTGSLIGAYLMKHYRMKAREAIAWLRICRPGSVICHQQAWMEDMQHWLWKCGDYYRMRKYGNVDYISHHKYGIYSIKAKMQKRDQERKGTPTSKNITGSKEDQQSTKKKSSYQKTFYYGSNTVSQEKKEYTDNIRAVSKESHKLSTAIPYAGRTTDYNDSPKSLNCGQKSCVWQNKMRCTHSPQQCDSKKCGTCVPLCKKVFTQGDYLRAIKMQQSKATPQSTRDNVFLNHSHKLSATKY